MVAMDNKITDSRDRRRFIGGSDARIIMGSDESALIRLWREKRGVPADPLYQHLLLTAEKKFRLVD